ncbi:MAG: sigma 54-interacting transcriptional regulator, partial [Desulfatiglandaceae bacterium]
VIELEQDFPDIIGRSDTLKYVLFKIEQVAPTDAPVFIAGETGTGKELVARSIHHLSPRKDKLFLKVNCAALPPQLIESELFGHERGAYTGAHTGQIGRFELAHGGTLFLDEIGELPLELQPKLLRVLQDGEFEKVGSPRTLKADVRVIAATNRDVQEEIKNGRFREDLWYRLNVFPITVPPLRKRKDDLPMLVEHFIAVFNKQLGKFINRIPSEAMEALKAYDWPGNIRELENVIHRAMIVSPGPDFMVELPEGVTEIVGGSSTLQDVERKHILRLLKESAWKIEGKNGAAGRLGLNPGTLRSRMKKLGIQKPH